MLAILKDAVTTLVNNAGHTDARRRRLYQDVCAWVAADDEEWVFSFIDVCNSLKLDVGQVRRWISGSLRDVRQCGKPTIRYCRSSVTPAAH